MGIEGYPVYPIGFKQCSLLLPIDLCLKTSLSEYQLCPSLEVNIAIQSLPHPRKVVLQMSCWSRSLLSRFGEPLRTFNSSPRVARPAKQFGFFLSTTSLPKMSTNPVFKEGNHALITGGASGIGYALAQKCVGYGMKVLIVDNNSSNLDAAKSALNKVRDASATTLQMDVSKLEDWDKLKKLVTSDFNGEYFDSRFRTSEEDLT